MAGRAYHHGNLQEALIEAATAIVREGGPNAVSMRAIAERVGVSRAAPYHHFRDKEAILVAVATIGFGMLNDEIRVAIGDIRDPWQILHRMGHAYIRFALRERQLVHLMFNKPDIEKSRYQDLANVGISAYTLLLQTVTHCLEDIGATDRNPEVIAMTTWSTVHGLAMIQADGTGDVVRKHRLGLDHPDCAFIAGPDEEMIDAVIDTLSAAIRGLKP